VAAVGQAQVLERNALPEWEGIGRVALIVLVVCGTNNTAYILAKGFIICAAVKTQVKNKGK